MGSGMRTSSECSAFQQSPVTRCRSAVARNDGQSMFSAAATIASARPGSLGQRQHSATNPNSFGAVFCCRFCSALPAFPALLVERCAMADIPSAWQKRSLMVRVNSLKRFTRLGLRRQCLVVEAVMALAVAAAAIALLPFRRAVKLGSIPLRGDRRAAVEEI